MSVDLSKLGVTKNYLYVKFIEMKENLNHI